MKNLKNLSLMLLILAAVFTTSSCKKDKNTDNEPGSSNKFVYQDKTIVVGDADYRKGNLI